MDNTDIAILNCLSENARMNASDIAEKVSLSTSAVIERIRKMENAKIIRQYTTIVDYAILGKDVSALMAVSIDHPANNPAFEAAVQGMPDVLECQYIAGDFDYMLKIVTKNSKSLQDVLNHIKAVEGVSKTKTMVVLSSIKERTSVELKSKK